VTRRGRLATAAVVAGLGIAGWGRVSGAGEGKAGLEGTRDHVRALNHAVDYLVAARPGLEFGVAIYREGAGVVYERDADRPRPAASAVKTFVALDLIRMRGDRLDGAPAGLDTLLVPGVHPAFEGFTDVQLAEARKTLTGLGYLQIARIMMDRTEHQNDVYNAACNVLMIDLGGPKAIESRIRALAPEFAALDLNRYMLSWNHDGDNLVTPRVLMTLYREIAGGRLGDLGDGDVAMLRDLLRSRGDGGPGSRFEKQGTLYPDPMVRVQAGYLERGDRDLVYAIMGQFRRDLGIDTESGFLGLLAAVDTLTAICTEIP
jgi:hypothetical protein